MGDYRIMLIRSDNSFAFAPDTPGFTGHRAAVSFIRRNGSQFANTQLAVVRFCDLVAPVVTRQVTTELSFKPRKNA